MSEKTLTNESVGQVGQVFTTSEASEKLNYGIRHIRRLCETGQLIANKRGGRWLINAPLIVRSPVSAVHDTS